MRIKVVALAACVVMMSAGMLWAEDAAASKEVTLTGSRMCAKCKLKEADKCQDVLEVKDGDKVTKYYMVDAKDSKVVKSGHVCNNQKDNVTITGIVTEKDGKKTIEVTKVN